ncbi:UDP-N-acetylmuramoyl-L-alanyl-D-glutamate--2,6-diaminopimelate ligase [Paenibacillus endoradicis]|uniref:UDP-N-acetylmuramoyl-L-alanyl-D-glutamate--2, 6-diaminopimelate ligase n=1 Tax=Paenibacillus endoradicis TaxID=2972487 RepID=UPI0021593765|nr:UDP-N-acetylmuramoyl-L-alanyl-D-glutamate--2,6-diaminopimelate ligase [Paenibacillus endoradicis]MCR8660075.1 UDP-N-acetylmuramoyl-L-alanyl-D-glutamate--2,6-diaminopimelate ligase [Paenibacillus endoradicis]
MKLEQLINKLLFTHIIGNVDVEVAGIHNDSRAIKSNDMFVCTKGAKENGHAYIPQAIANGAKIIVIQDKQERYEEGITYILVPDTGKAASIMVDAFYSSPTRQLKLIGVTGTNGKTTTTNLIEHILTYHQHKTGVIGTIEIRYPGYQEEAKLTTPLCYELQRYFYNMKQADVDYAVMEVSSHSLDLGRIHGCRFKTAVFTNLTQDHLDYHLTMEAYGEAKGLLFAQLGNDYEQASYAVLNSDDPWSERYARKTSAQIITYGLGEAALVRATNINITAAGTSFTLTTPLGEVELSTKLIGKFNVYNLLAAISAVIPEGLTLNQIKEAIEGVEGVPGRFEAVQQGQPFAVIVDYAHTPDSLENVLRTAQQLEPKKLICVVGCGGDRDRTKRPLMANIAIEMADHVYFTSDNPRTEDPVAILADMTDHLTEGHFTTHIDRKLAIEDAINEAQAGDIIVIAGKGHENYQIIGTEKSHFDDKEVARDQLIALGYTQS